MNIPIITITRTPYLIENLARLEVLRKDIHALILPRQTELQLRWDAHSLRTFYAFSLYDLSLQRNKVISYLSKNYTFTGTTPANVLLRYRQALLRVEYDWYASNRKLDYDDFEELYKGIWPEAFPVSRKEFLEAVLFLEERERDPVVLALLLFLFMYQYHIVTKSILPYAHLVFYLILVRSGWNFRGIVVFEEFFHRERVYYKKQLQKSIESKSATGWLEYATAGFIPVIENLYAQYTIVASPEGRPASFFHLTDRQKKILLLLEEPQSVISNKKVQQLCGVSQITASRELAKLVELGLLFPSGKGRSTIYIRTHI
ncbi:MAG: hypothetical protein N2691_05640 [Patescibacteria group bacterium]|nr:hypothetical protein [Patescibacteria group bacterium]